MFICSYCIPSTIMSKNPHRYIDASLEPGNVRGSVLYGVMYFIFQCQQKEFCYRWICQYKKQSSATSPTDDYKIQRLSREE